MSTVDGFLNNCKECVKKRVRNQRAAAISYYKQYDKTRAVLPHRIAVRKKYLKTKAGRAAMRRAREKFKANNPDKHQAHIVVHSALRNGVLERKPCEMCGGKKVQAHHDDYRFPLRVRWLCAKDHRLEHKGRNFNASNV